MARNEEKSQSMLFRFRESQMADLGMTTRTDKRPRGARQCTDLRQAEKWRGEVLRDISRKVTKIQDINLGDYEIRDLNDGINDLLREKANWENQIISLGGANYKRAAGKTMDADGKEVPGTKGYKYFGRARDLPGVKELFSNTAENDAELNSHRNQVVDKFVNPPPGYFGDLDEDEDLLAYESLAEGDAWTDAIENLLEETSLEFNSLPPLPKPSYISLAASTSTIPPPPPEPISKPGDKRKATTANSKSKKAKLDATAAATALVEEEQEQKKAAGGFLSILKESDMKEPKLMETKEMEDYIVATQKAELLKLYLE